jgi:para-aminobenzoate synthetase component I
MIGSAGHRHLVCEEQETFVDCWDAARGLSAEPFLFLLESVDTAAELGRYTMLAWQPRWEFVAKNGVAHSGPPGASKPLEGNVLAELDSVMNAFSRSAASQDAGTSVPPAFSGGAIGFFAYELLHEIEAIPPSSTCDLGVADCHLLFCDVVVITDEVAQRSWIVSNGWGESERESRINAQDQLKSARAICMSPGPTPPSEPPPMFAGAGRLVRDDLEAYGIQALTPSERYVGLVERAREHIFAGDVFELCLTQRFDTDFDGDGIELYAAMRRVNPAPMAAYLRFPDLEVLSSSPERFLRVDRQRWVETRPIKGTRPRGKTTLEDQALAVDLASAIKDGAENMMIVDLARNDLGRVCDFGTVNVPTLRAVEAYASVFQLVSTIRGRLRENVTPVQLLRATFPGGSMTGAPKIEAMRLINLLEDSRRGVFSGAIGYMSYSGELDLSIVIRTIIKRGDSLSFHTGGAVTSDSVPADEYQETLDKACALVRAIEAGRVSRWDQIPAPKIRAAVQ